MPAILSAVTAPVLGVDYTRIWSRRWRREIHGYKWAPEMNCRPDQVEMWLGILRERFPGVQMVASDTVPNLP